MNPEAWLRRIALSLEKHFASGEDLSRPHWHDVEEPAPNRDGRVILPGYDISDGGEQPAPDPVREPERAATRATRAPRQSTVRSPWSRETPGSPVSPPVATQPAPQTRGAQAADRTPWGASGSRTTPPHAHSPAHALSERMRARLGTPDALREAFVIKEILDRPLARRRAR